jgi:hypothetical protein
MKQFKTPSQIKVGFVVFINMKLLNVLKDLITEAIFIDEFDIDGQKIKIVQTYESLRGVSQSSKTGRVDVDEIMDSMSDIYEVIVEQSFSVLDACRTDCALVIRDFRLGFDYQLFIKKDKKDKLVISINTSIRHPKDLKNTEKKTREIIITRNEDVVIKEILELALFTKIIKDDIIVYIK